VAEEVGAGGGVGSLFRRCCEDGAEGYVVGGFVLRFDHLGGGVGGEADDCGGVDDFAGVGGGEVFLAEVEGYGFVFSDLFGLEEGGVVGSVVDDEEDMGLGALGG